MKKKIIVFIVCLVVMAVCAGLGIKLLNNKPTDAYDKVVFMEPDFPIFDLNDKEQYVGFSDYVFVGRVEKVTYGGNHTDKYYPASNPSKDKTALPYTDYEISVLQNIKGQFKTNEVINVKKHAGINSKTNSLSIIHGDVMPVENEEYIFLTKATEDGNLVIIDPFGNIPLSDKGNNVFLNEPESVNYTDTDTTAVVKSNDNVPTTSSNQDNQAEKTREGIIYSYIIALPKTEEDILSEKEEALYFKLDCLDDNMVFTSKDYSKLRTDELKNKYKAAKAEYEDGLKAVKSYENGEISIDEALKRLNVDYNTETAVSDVSQVSGE